MNYYLYINYNKEEYFIKKLNLKNMNKLYDIIRLCFEETVWSENIALEKFILYNKVILTYPVFDYNFATIFDYSIKDINHINDFLSLSNDNFLKEDLEWCYINNKLYFAVINKFQSSLDKFMPMLPKIKDGTRHINIDLLNIEGIDLQKHIEVNINSIIKSPNMHVHNKYKQMFISEDKGRYLPFVITEEEEIKCICNYNFNSVELLLELISEYYPDANIEFVNYLDSNILYFSNYKLLNISTNQIPCYAFYPNTKNNHTITSYGSIDNQYFNSKSNAILYASRFKNTEINDDSVIPYINGGEPFKFKSIDYNILSQIQNIDKIYEDMKYRDNKINAINNHGKSISESIDNVAIANTNIANNLKTGLKYVGDTIDNAGVNIGNSIITGAEIDKGLHMLA